MNSIDNKKLNGKNKSNTLSSF